MPFKYFYPRSPCGERQGLGLISAGLYRISIHALLAESDTANLDDWWTYAISIHALLAESDLIAATSNPETGISIHALLAESDILGNVVAGLHMSFLSTLSLRRATL